MKTMLSRLTALACTAMIAFAVGCQPPEDVDTSVDLSTDPPADVSEPADSNVTLGVETPDSNITGGVETPDANVTSAVETPDVDDEAPEDDEEN